MKIALQLLLSILGRMHAQKIHSDSGTCAKNEASGAAVSEEDAVGLIQVRVQMQQTRSVPCTQYDSQKIAPQNKSSEASGNNPCTAHSNDFSNELPQGQSPVQAGTLLQQVADRLNKSIAKGDSLAYVQDVHYGLEASVFSSNRRYMCTLCALIYGVACLFGLGYIMWQLTESSPLAVGSAEEVPVFAKKVGRVPEMTAIALPRLIGAVHIVLLHFYQVPGFLFPLYGNSWVPFFFVLSGLGATHSKLSIAARDRSLVTYLFPRPRTLLRRLATVYPLYAFALIVQVTLQVVRDGDQLRKAQLGIESALLQSWMPSRYIAGELYNQPDWFVSTLAGCFFIEEAAFMAVVALWRIQPQLVVAISCAAWALGVGLVSQLGVNETCQFFFCYFTGIVVAFVVHDRAGRGSPPFRFAASIATLLLVLVFQVNLDPREVQLQDQWFADLWFKKAAILLPVHCLLLLGLAEGHDPVAKIFSVWPFPYAQDLAYGVYILQAPVINFLFTKTDNPMTTQKIFISLVVLLPTAAAAQALSKPLIAYAKVH